MYEQRKQETDMFANMLEKNKEVIDKLSDNPDRFKAIRYVDREEDPELKKNFEDSQASLFNLQNTLKGKVDG